MQVQPTPPRAIGLSALFAAHLGDGTADSSISGANQRFFYSATVSSNEKVLHLKLVNASSIGQPLSLKPDWREWRAYC